MNALGHAVALLSHNVPSGERIKVDDRPAVHASVKRVVQKIAWVLEGVRHGQLSEADALARVDAIVREVE